MGSRLDRSLEMVMLVKGKAKAGEHILVFDAQGLASEMSLDRSTTSPFSEIRTTQMLQ